MIGHTLGGGFIARVAATPVGARFERFVLLSPFLGARAPAKNIGLKSICPASLRSQC